MKISIIGTGYVGLVTGVVLASKGHNVICVDLDRDKVDKINNAIPPIHEEGLDKLLRAVIESKKLTATTNLKGAILDSELCFICVGTPSKHDGSIDTSQLENAAMQIGAALKDKNNFLSIVVKSTIIPGTTEKVVIPAIMQESKKRMPDHFSICYSPEFLREGKAIEDTLNPDKLVIGSAKDNVAANNLKSASAVSCPIIETDFKAAELIKYANNAFLATKISFINEIGALCKTFNVDSYVVSKAIGFDKRIGPHFLNAGLGFGGSCFPKDVKALISAGKKQNCDLKLLKTVLEINDLQAERLVHMAEKKIGNLKDRTIAVLGTAFKPGTDDIRESQSIKVIGLLLTKGAKVKVYDPIALENTKKELADKIEYCNSTASCLEGAELCLICTDWPEFKFIDFIPMKEKIVIDSRHVLEKKENIDYEGMYW